MPVWRIDAQPSFETGRVLLRPRRLADTDACLAIVGDPIVRRFSSRSTRTTAGLKGAPAVRDSVTREVFQVASSASRTSLRSEASVEAVSRDQSKSDVSPTNLPPGRLSSPLGRGILLRNVLN